MTAEFLQPAALTAELSQPPAALTPEYMLMPIEDGFNWSDYFAHIDSGQWYLVAFRSKHAADADEALLTRLDDAASAAARETPGFLFYFIGTPKPTGECLSFCLWDSQANARAGSARPAHRTAVEQGMSAFEYYTLERHIIRKTPDQLTFTRLA